MSAVEAEIVDEPHETALARPRSQDDAAEQIRMHVEKASLAMQLRWEEERKQRETWDEDDKLEAHRVRLTATLAAGIIGEGAASVRPRADQVASMACEYADAILKELKKYIHRDKEARAQMRGQR
jgi:hypothetical protein